eukprot:12108991-Alexandrium_andersonii.AAC.1
MHSTARRPCRRRDPRPPPTRHLRRVEAAAAGRACSRRHRQLHWAALRSQHRRQPRPHRPGCRRTRTRAG